VEVAVGEKALYRLSLRFENLESGLHLCFDQQFDMRRVRITNRQISACVSCLSTSKENRAEASRVEVVETAEIEHEANLPRCESAFYVVSKLEILQSEREASFEVQNAYSLIFPMDDSEHAALLQPDHLSRHSGVGNYIWAIQRSPTFWNAVVGTNDLSCIRPRCWNWKDVHDAA